MVHAYREFILSTLEETLDLQDESDLISLAQLAPCWLRHCYQATVLWQNSVGRSKTMYATGCCDQTLTTTSYYNKTYDDDDDDLMCT